MNIVILGGGQQGKFGNDFAIKAREAGHNVTIFSHKLNGVDEQQHVIDYDNLHKTGIIFESVLGSLGKIDIILFNQNGLSYPHFDEHFDMSRVRINDYYQAFNLHVIVPHLLLSKAYDYMNDGARVVYMTSGLGFRVVRDEYHKHYGYGAFKSFFTHLTMGFAYSRTKKITYSVLSPHFPYENKSDYLKILQRCTDYILTHDDSYNGKLLGAWDGDRDPYPLYFMDVSEPPKRN